MLTQVCRHIKNFFVQKVYEGEYTVLNGNIYPTSFLSEGDYYLIAGSRFNDGVHVYPSYDLRDESFSGRISVMAPPIDFLKTVMEIEEYCKDGGDKAGPYMKESFGGYSYTRLTGSDGSAITWQKAFKSKLNAWRKV